jgi:hypothetical protein
MIICVDMEGSSNEISTPCINNMKDSHNLFFIGGLSQFYVTQLPIIAQVVGWENPEQATKWRQL